MSYQKDETPFSAYEEDFIKNMTDYLLFKEEIDVKTLKEALANKVIYFSNLSIADDSHDLSIEIERGDDNESD